MKGKKMKTPKKLYITIEKECVGDWTIDQKKIDRCIRNAMNPVFLQPIWNGITMGRKDKGKDGLRTTDKHGKFAYPQVGFSLPWRPELNAYDPFVVYECYWDKTYFRDKFGETITYYSNEGGWCWFNKFTDMRMILDFLLRIRKGVIDYVKSDADNLTPDLVGLHICRRDENNPDYKVELDFIENPNRRK